jgi:hypothetical protein
MEIVKRFENGRSGSSVFLVEISGTQLVYKAQIKNVPGVLQLNNLLPFDRPDIVDNGSDWILMQYIPGISMREYFATATQADLHKLIDFIRQYFDFSIASSIQMVDYKNTITDKITALHEFISPEKIKIDATVFPRCVVHGDFTFENIIYYAGKFYMIDLSPGIFDSIYFDANKFRQDLSGYWFARYETNKQVYIDCCNYIYNELSRHYDFFNDELYKLMISRILPYCDRNDTFESNFIGKEIDRICKL